MSAGATSQAGACITLAASHGVDPAAAEDRLAALWRQASESSTSEGPSNVTRACLWNLLVYHPHANGKPQRATPHGPGLRKLLDEVILSVPARIIRLEFTPRKKEVTGAKSAEAWVAAKCLDGPGGKRQIYGEEINLKVGGKRGDSHFPSLVRALLHANLPIALLGLDDLPAEGWMLRQLLALCDRVLVDSGGKGEAARLTRIRDFMDTTEAYVVDIGWMRLTPIRYLLAGFFDTPDRTEQLSEVDRITVRATPSGKNGGLLLLGWFLARCGFGKLTPAVWRGAKNTWRWKAARRGHTAEARLEVRPGEGGADGLLLVEVMAQGERFAIRQADALHVALESPDGTESKVALHGWSDAELVIAAVGAHGIDRVFVEALQEAADLLGPEG